MRRKQSPTRNIHIGPFGPQARLVRKLFMLVTDDAIYAVNVFVVYKYVIKARQWNILTVAGTLGYHVIIHHVPDAASYAGFELTFFAQWLHIVDLEKPLLFKFIVQRSLHQRL